MNLQRREEISALLAEPVTGEAGQALEYRDALMECRAHIDTLEQTAAERVIARGAVVKPHTFGEIINQVRDIANQHAGTEQLREQIAYALAPHFERDAGPTPDYTGEGSAWVPPVEAWAVVVPESDEVESLRDTVRFLASVVSKGAQIRHQIIFSLHENKPDEAKDYAMMKWPIIQGMQNQIDLEKVGKQAYTPKRIRLAVDSLLGIRANQGGTAT